MKNIEDYISLLDKAESIDDAFLIFSEIMAEYGYTRVAYSLITDHISLGLPKQHGLATSYPGDWMTHYNEKKYLKDDPVVLAILKSCAPFFWEDLKKDPNFSEYSISILNQGQQAGIYDGIGIPLIGKAGEVVGIGLAKENKENTRDYEFLSGVYFLSAYFHQKFRHFLTEPTFNKITERERDILSWAAEGKTDEEIGYLLGISAHTVRWHWKKIFTKLNAQGRIYAITKAVALGMVFPNFVIAPP